MKTASGKKAQMKLLNFLKPLERRIEWEPMAGGPGSAKQVFTYDKHEKRLDELPYNRAASPQEIFSLLIAHFEGKINDRLLEITIEDLLNKGEEFTCHAVRRETEKRLEIFEQVSGLIPQEEIRKICGPWDPDERRYLGPTYTAIVYQPPEGNWYKRKKVFVFDFQQTEVDEDDDQYTGVAGRRLYLPEINKFNPEFVKYLTGKKFDEIPKELKKTTFDFPIQGKLTPIVFYKDEHGFRFAASGKGASRGVR